MRNIKKITFPVFTSKISQYIIVLLVITLTVLLCKPLANQQGYLIVSFILLFVISIMAAFLGIGPILLASTISALVWNFFFIPPQHTFNIAATEDKFMFGSFFIIALLNGVMTNRIRRQERLVRKRERETNALFQLAGELSKANGINKVLEVAERDFRNYFNVDSFIILQDGNNKLTTSVWPRDKNKPPDIDFNLAEWVFNNSVKAGRFTDSFTDAGLTYYPLTGTRLNPGVIALNFDKSVYAEKDAFRDTYFAQISNALEREFLGEFALKAHILDESDKLYKTLFNLISHEFRIPIAAIMGASDTLLLSETSEKYREELLNEIFKASARLNHLIENLLNMSRLESGKISVRPDWCDINDLVNKVTQNLKQELEQFHLVTVIPHGMPLIRLDFGLMEQVIYNLLLNSCQHSSESTFIRIEALYENGSFVLQVADKGPGFPSEALLKVFDKFFKVDNSKSGGLGLGLSIVKGLVEAHKGTVIVENLQEGGAKFTIKIPSEIPDMQKINLD